MSLSEELGMEFYLEERGEQFYEDQLSREIVERCRKRTRGIGKDSESNYLFLLIEEYKNMLNLKSLCPDCGTGLIHQSSCTSCRSCGYERC